MYVTVVVIPSYLGARAGQNYRRNKAFGMLITCALAIHCCLSYAEHIVHCTLCLSEATQSMYVLTQESVSLHCSLFLVYCLN